MQYAQAVNTESPICAKEGVEGTLALFMALYVFVLEKGWKSGTFIYFWLESGKYAFMH